VNRIDGISTYAIRSLDVPRRVSPEACEPTTDSEIRAGCSCEPYEGLDALGGDSQRAGPGLPTSRLPSGSDEFTRTMLDL